MAGSKFDYLKMLYDDFSKKREAFLNHNSSIENHVEGLSQSVYAAAKLYREKYEGLRLYKNNKPQTTPQTPFELDDPKDREDQDELQGLSDKLENVDDKIEGAIKEIQYRYSQLGKVIASFQAVSANYKDIINNIFDTWDDIVKKEEEQ